MFENLTSYHKFALMGFVLAKMCGMLGVCLGFAGGELRQLGGGLLGFAFISIFFSVIMSCLQMGRDQETFQYQDHIACQNSKLKKERAQLLKEVESLKRDHAAMLELKIKNRVF